MLQGTFKKILKNGKVNFKEIFCGTEDSFKNYEKTGKICEIFGEGNEKVWRWYDELSRKFWKIINFEETLVEFVNFYQNCKKTEQILKFYKFRKFLKMLQGFRKILRNRKVKLEEILEKSKNSYENCEKIREICTDFGKVLRNFENVTWNFRENFEKS